MSNEPSMAGLYANDPTVDLTGDPDKANGTEPNPPLRYGQPLPKEWIPLYRRPMRTPRSDYRCRNQRHGTGTQIPARTQA
jgi:hypothetical protein